MNPPGILELFFIFFYIGLFTIGGGLVAITTMYQIIVGRGWLTDEKFYNMIAISESTPGAIGINMATYIGYEFHGVPGGIITTLGEILPSFICIIIIARFFSRFQEKPFVKAAFSTLRPAAAGIILVACTQIFVLALLNIPAARAFDFPQSLFYLFNWKQLCFYALSLFALIKIKLHPVFVILSGALFGIIFL